MQNEAAQDIARARYRSRLLSSSFFFFFGGGGGGSNLDTATVKGLVSRKAVCVCVCVCVMHFFFVLPSFFCLFVLFVCCLCLCVFSCAFSFLGHWSFVGVDFFLFSFCVK